MCGCHSKAQSKEEAIKTNANITRYENATHAHTSVPVSIATFLFSSRHENLVCRNRWAYEGEPDSPLHAAACSLGLAMRGALTSRGARDSLWGREPRGRVRTRDCTSTLSCAARDLALLETSLSVVHTIVRMQRFTCPRRFCRSYRRRQQRGEATPPVGRLASVVGLCGEETS